MRTAQSLVAAAGKQLAQPQTSQLAATQPLGEVDTQTAEVVGKIFRQLQAIYPAWKQAWPDDKALTMAQRSWTRGLMAAGISSLDQVKYGIEQCRQHGSPFAPSIGQFVKWCQPTAEMLGLPDEEKAYQEAVRNAHPSVAGHAKWSHAMVSHAARECGLYSLSSLPMDASRKLFARNYAIAMRMVLAGEALKPIPLGLPETVDARRTPEVGRAALAGLRNAIKGMTP